MNKKDISIPAFLSLSSEDANSDSLADYTIVGLEEFILQINQNNSAGYCNDGMAKLLGFKKKSEIIGFPIDNWDKGPLGEGFFSSIILSVRQTNKAVVFENTFDQIEYRDFPGKCSADICGPVRLRFICSSAKGKIQIVIQDVTKTHWLETNFSRYVSPDVIEKMRSLREDSILKYEKRVVTVLFADLRGFTLFCQELDVDEVAELVNGFISNMVSCIESHDGMVDKFIGDEVMAVFGAPIVSDDHALRALMTAADMINVHKDWSLSRTNIGKSSPRVGIGIATGEAIVGNIGTKNRMEYTALGHTVNIAARLCGIADGYEILITEETHKSAYQAYSNYQGKNLTPRFKFAPKEQLVLKNIIQPVKVFAVVSKI